MYELIKILDKKAVQYFLVSDNTKVFKVVQGRLEVYPNGIKDSLQERTSASFK